MEINRVELAGLISEANRLFYGRQLALARAQQKADRGKLLRVLAPMSIEERTHHFENLRASLAKTEPERLRELLEFRSEVEFQLTEIAEGSPRVRR
ncbi:hypothetical protein ISS86_02435 [Candidatus Microgenomates bacterium]|nr:hypothetical protein [Candidatus Microgenomates bacterium]